jgi:hypothetical protein
MPRGPAEERRIEARRAQVAKLYLQGYRRQDDIAEKLGVDRATVSRDLKVVNERWKEAGVRDLDQAKGQELERLALLEQESWAAWEASKQARETSTTEQVTGGEGERYRAALRKEGQTGDPRYFTAILSCIAIRSKILGLNAPKKPNDPDPVDSRPLTDADRVAECLALLNAGRKRAAGAAPGPGPGPAPAPGDVGG